jgi:hypothetical protein
MDFIKTASDALFAKSKPEGEAPQLDEKKIVAYVRQKVEEVKQQSSRSAFESSVVTNTAYLLGYDSVYYDPKVRLFRNYAGGAANPSRGRVHRNFILPTVQNRLAKLCKNPPRFEVRPNSPDEDDKEAARLSLKILLNVLDRERYNEKRIELAMWMQQAGYAYVKVFWDKSKGERLVYTDELSGEEVSEFAGDIAVDVVSPLEIYVDPLAKRMDDAAWLLHAKVRPLSYFRDNFPDKGHEVKSEEAWLSSIQNVLKISQMTTKGAGTDGQELMKNSAIELSYYEKPTKKFPNGRLIVTAGNVLLSYKPLPVDEINYVKFDDVKVGGKFHSESLITHMRPIQDQMNRILRRKTEFLNKCLAAKFIAPKGHGMNEEALSDNTEVLEYNPNPNASPPTAMNTPQMPQYAFQEDAVLKQSFDEIAGISEVSKGQLPSASIPAVGMQLLVEQDDSRIGIVVESNENSHSDVGRIILKFAAKYYRTPRMLKEMGEAGQYNFTQYTSEDMRENFDVFVIRGSTLPGSKVLKRQELLNLYGQGILGNPQDPQVQNKLLQALEFGDIADVWADVAIDAAQVDRSIKMIEEGVKPLVDPDDNHQMHYERKNRLRKSEKFKTYAPEIQALLRENIAAHKQFMAMEMAPQPETFGEAPQSPGFQEPNPEALTAEQEPPIEG